jgi:Methyladenine glycosylase/Haem-degrading
VLFLSGDQAAKPAVAQLIADAGFEPVDLGGIDDSKFQDPGSALWNTTLEADDAKTLAERIRAGDPDATDPLTAPFEKLRDHAPDDPAFFFEHLCRAVFQAGISWRVVQAKWDGIREAFGGFDPAKIASLQPAAAAIGMPVDDFFEAIKDDPAAVASFAARPGLALIAGGVPLLEGTTVIGGLGVAGAMTAAEDRKIAEAGAGRRRRSPQ